MPFSGYDDLNPEYAMRLQAFVAASGGRVSITSGFRSVERQAELFRQAVAKYGSEAAARKWVAPPGKSNHNHGIAADLGFADAGAREWAHANAARFGLHFPMSWEPWHIEPLGSVTGSDRDAYTDPPPGHAHPADAVPEEDPHDPVVQLGRLMGALVTPGETGMESPSSEVTASPTAPGSSMEVEQQVSEVAGAIDGT